MGCAVEARVLMKKRIGLLLTGLGLALALSACAGTSAEEEARMLSALRQGYRSADLVALCTCTQRYTDEQGRVCALLQVDEIIAGEAAPRVVCLSDALQEGADYLAYLAADGTAYTLLCAARWNTQANTAALEDVTLPMAKIREDIQAHAAVISAPSGVWFYRQAEALEAAADEIFIGRLLALPALTDTAFREESEAATVEHSLPAAIVQVQVLGNIKGELGYGDVVSLVQAPGLSADLVDATTLTAVRYGEADVPVLEEDAYYVFFLVRGPDAKQHYYFSVNPVQGYVRLNEDILLVPESNEALAGYDTLLTLLAGLRPAD